MNRLVLPLAVLSAVFLMSCDEGPTDLDTENAPLLKPGGKPGKPGGGTPASPAIVYQTQGSDIAVMDADGSNATVVLTVDDLGTKASFPRWSPLGEGTEDDPYRVVFRKNDAQQLAVAEFFVDASGSVTSIGWALLETGIGQVYDAEYSPDGSLLAIAGGLPSSCGEVDDTPNRSLYVMPADGAAPAEEVYCSTAPYGIYDPSWSPDGTAIAFHEEFDDDNLPVIGESAIRICNLGPSGCVITTAVDRSEADHLGTLDWLNDGSGLLYTSIQVKRWRWVKSVRRVSLGKDANGMWTRLPGEPIELFDGEDPTSSPDDSHIAASGLVLHDAVTLDRTRAPKGIRPDWRLPAN